MIGKLKGNIDSSGEDWVLVDVGGVCYEVSCSTRTLTLLPAIGEQIVLSIETYVREDQIRLFGFATENERTWFRLLQSVQGVGAKVALAILGTLSPSDLTNAITLQDKAMVSRAPGVGPKVAQRIVSELKDKVGALNLDPSMTEGSGLSGTPSTAEAASHTSATADAISALTNLGYAPAQASAAIAAVYKEAEENAGPEELIRLGLKELAK
ncbi:MAG: Holliday junction branch migration protein RuvA [Pseudomonadota bacterium]